MGEEEISEGAVEGAVGGVLAEGLAVFLVEGGGGFWGEGLAGGDDFVGVGGEMFAVFFEGGVGGVFFPVGAEFPEGVEGGGFAEGFFEPFVFVLGGLEVGADVGEFVGELVDELGVVAVFATELDGDFATGGAFEEGDGAIGMMGDEEGWGFGAGGRGEEVKGGLEEGADFGFFHAEVAGVDANLGGGELGEEGENEEDEDEELHFLRLGRRLPLMRAWMRSGQFPSLRRRSQVASMRRLWRTAR